MYLNNFEVVLIIMSKYVHIIPYGLEKDRSIYLLKKFPPFRVYFLIFKNDTEYDAKFSEKSRMIMKDVDSMITLAEKKYITVSYDNFEDLFLRAFTIMAKEKENENEVIAHEFVGPRMANFACWLAASLTGSKAYYIRAAEYLPKEGGTFSSGVLKEIELLQIPVMIPSRSEINLLEYLLDHKGSAKGSLRNFVMVIGLENLGNMKSLNSGIVKMSYCIKELKRNHYIEIKGISRKQKKIELTKLGTLIAKTYKILKDEKFSSKYFSTD